MTTKERPILFSTPMVQAIPEGRKTMTRRTRGLEVINKNPDDFQFEWADFSLKLPWRFTQKFTVNELSLKERNFNQEAIKCPYGEIGDRLWVKETSCFVSLEHAQDLLEGMHSQLVYKTSVHEDWMKYAKEKYRYKWTPSIYMTRAACRIILEITNIGVERLIEISEEDARQEGIELIQRVYGSSYTWDNCVTFHGTAKLAFQNLWEKINGADSWDFNPWVWIIKFKVI